MSLILPSTTKHAAAMNATALLSSAKKRGVALLKSDNRKQRPLDAEIEANQAHIDRLKQSLAHAKTQKDLVSILSDCVKARSYDRMLTGDFLAELCTDEEFMDHLGERGKDLTEHYQEPLPLKGERLFDSRESLVLDLIHRHSEAPAWVTLPPHNDPAAHNKHKVPRDSKKWWRRGRQAASTQTVENHQAKTVRELELADREIMNKIRTTTEALRNDHKLDYVKHYRPAALVQVNNEFTIDAVQHTTETNLSGNDREVVITGPRSKHSRNVTKRAEIKLVPDIWVKQDDPTRKEEQQSGGEKRKQGRCASIIKAAKRTYKRPTSRTK